jgi:hypothetical protein
MDVPSQEDSVDFAHQRTERTNVQEAPYPTELADLVERCTLDPDWRVRLVELDRGQGSKGLTLVIVTKSFDTYHPDRGRTYRVQHFFPVPPAAYDRRSWRRWLFDRYLDVLTHEGAEMFVIDGKRPYAPSHGDGNDPYMIRERGTDEDAQARPGGGA